MFHNGRELTSDDVVYTFGSFLDPAFRGRIGRVPSAGQRHCARSVHRRVQAEDARRDRLPINLVMGIVQAGSGAANARAPIGTGPYRLAEFVPDDRVVLKAFDRTTTRARRATTASCSR